MGTAPTTAGNFTITRINFNDWTGQVVVAAPAPPGLTLGGVATLCLAGWGLLRRRRGQPAVADLRSYTMTNCDRGTFALIISLIALIS